MNIYLLLVFVILTAPLNSQTLDEIFNRMPTEILPGIDEDNKTMLLVDTAKITIPFAFGEIVKLKHSDNYLLLQTSDIGTTQLMLLPIDNDSVIVSVINTVCGGVSKETCNSDISFYTTEWEELDKNLFIPELTAELFFDSSMKSSENYEYALSLPDMSPVSALYDETNNSLKLNFNYKEHLMDTHIETIKTFLKSDSVILNWENSSFK